MYSFTMFDYILVNQDTVHLKGNFKHIFMYVSWTKNAGKFSEYVANLCGYLSLLIYMMGNRAIIDI